jgi:hypothetical protein
VTAREGSLRAAARGEGRAKGTGLRVPVFSPMELHARMSGWCPNRKSDRMKPSIYLFDGRGNALGGFFGGHSISNTLLFSKATSQSSSTAQAWTIFPPGCFAAPRSRDFPRGLYPVSSANCALRRREAPRLRQSDLLVWTTIAGLWRARTGLRDGRAEPQYRQLYRGRAKVPRFVYLVQLFSRSNTVCHDRKWISASKTVEPARAASGVISVLVVTALTSGHQSARHSFGRYRRTQIRRTLAPSMT